jgi:predicted transcriptional regulator
LKISSESKRSEVLEFIKTNPGTHLREIKRRLNIAMGTVQYHIQTLEKEKTIISRRKGPYKRFYPNYIFKEKQQEILDILSQETEREILLYLIQNPVTTQKAISEYAGISLATTYWHMNRLNDAGFIEIWHKGHFVTYIVTTENTEILRLLKSYHPRIWEKWADRLADVIEGISLPGEDGEVKS